MSEIFDRASNMNFVYNVFRVYGHNKNVVYLATCSSEENAKQYCVDNKLLSPFIHHNILDRTQPDEVPLFTTRSAALLKTYKSIVIEKMTVI